jgi:uncharacterized protein YsxB (DUF464 family)
MITVRFEKCDGNVRSVRVTGHSGYADAGEDIVCSGISVLTIAVINGLTEVVGLRDEAVIVSLEPGHTAFNVPLSNDPQKKIAIAALIDTYELNVRATADEYQDYVKVIEKNTISGGKYHD